MGEKKWISKKWISKSEYPKVSKSEFVELLPQILPSTAESYAMKGYRLKLGKSVETIIFNMDFHSISALNISPG